MAKRRIQKPTPKQEGNFWYLRVWQDVYVRGVRTRQRERIKLAPATTDADEVQEIAEELLTPINQVITRGSGVNFGSYVDRDYVPGVLENLASTTQASYEIAIKRHLKPCFGSLCLRDLDPRTLKQFFSGMAREKVPYPTIVKVRDALSSILRSAVDDELLLKNPMQGLKLPRDKRPRRPKPTITPDQFANLVQLVAEPYATMIYVAMWTGFRISEVIGLKWRCIHADSISVEERYCRGDWSLPKTASSAATIGVSPEVIARILRLKTLTVEIRAGLATRQYKLVKSAAPDDLVFQSVQDGRPMNDQNILKRHLQPAARKLGLPFVTWRCLRTSHATWLVQAGADCKSVQGQMRHSRISTTMDIYAQIVPAAQRRALEKLTEFASGPNAVPLLVQ